MLPKKFIIITILLVAVFVAFGIWLGTYLSQPSQTGPSEYSAVYLSTGDIYYGKLNWFPWPRLTNVWILQRNIGQNNQVQLGLGQFTNAFWGPMDEVYLNPKQIVFWARLRSDSQVVKAIQNPSALQQPQVPATPPSATSTFRGPSTPPPTSR